MPPQQQDLLRKQIKAIEAASIEGIFTIDAQGTVISVNEQAARMFGLSVGEITGRNADRLMAPEEAAVERRHREKYGTSSILRVVNRSQTVSARRLDGTTFPIRLSVREVSDESTVYYTCVIHDLSAYRKSRDRILELHQRLRDQNTALETSVRERTEQLENTVSALAEANKKLALEIREREAIAQSLQKREVQLERLLRRERQVNELRSRFVSMASHEFRTPLTTMLSSIEIVEMSVKPAPPVLLKHARRIREGIGYLRNVLEDFLQLGKLDVRGTDLHVQELDLVEFTESLVSDLAMMSKPGQDLELSTDGDFAPTLHSANGLRIILTNLVGNAIKYSDDGSAIDVKLALDDDGLTLQVVDEGIGIPADEVPLLFERFYRASNAETIKGTGLGLHIAATYVKAMGGTIEVASEHGVGTTFTVRVPRCLEPPE